MFNKKYKGFLLAELIVSFSILGVLLAGLAVSLNGFAKFNLYQLVRQNCIAAGQGQLDSIAITGKPIPDEDFKRLWPTLEVSINETAGTGQWEGLKLVKVTTKGMSYNIPVKVRLSRYMSINQGKS
jgi:type II secretory pathway pseudopilin PulG